MLIDRQCMTALLDKRRRPHVVMQGEPALHARDRQRIPAHRTDCVVDAEIGDLNAPRPSNQELLGIVEILDALTGDAACGPCGCDIFFANQPGIPQQIRETPKLWSGLAEERREGASVMFAFASEEAVVLPELIDSQRRAAAQQSAGADETHERPRCERTATEAEYVDLISRLERVGVFEVLDQPVVSGSDVRLQSEPETAAGNLVERSRTETLEIELEL